PLILICEVGAALVIIPFKPRQVYQHFLWCRLAGEGRKRHAFVFFVVHDLKGFLRPASWANSLIRRYETGQAWTFQIAFEYSAMVRSLENLPEPATFKMVLRAHAGVSLYNSHSL